MEIPNNSYIASENQLIFLDTTKLVGVQSFNSSLNPGLRPLTYAGIGSKQVYYLPDSEQNTNVSINAFLINQDYYFDFVTGNSLFNTYVLVEKANNLTNAYSIISGYGVNYSCSYSYGQIPTISFNYIGIRNAGGLGISDINTGQLYTISTGNYDITPILVADAGSISLTLEDSFSTNRVLSYSLSTRSNKIPVYSMGSRFPLRIDKLGATDISCNFEVEISNFTYRKLRELPQNNVIKNLSLVVNSHDTNQAIKTYSFSNLNLVQEELISTDSQNIKVNLSYNTQIYG
ncbi:MAG: hypothetical protein AABY22_12585 [Nanoarchaeota archaeon]